MKSDKTQQVFSLRSIYGTHIHKSRWTNVPETIQFLPHRRKHQRDLPRPDRFLRLTDMPAEFRKAVYLILTNCTNAYAYLDDILIITKGSLELHKEKLQTVLRILNKEKLALSLEKRKFAFK